jgi:outer membrane protein
MNKTTDRMAFYRREDSVPSFASNLRSRFFTFVRPCPERISHLERKNAWRVGGASVGALSVGLVFAAASANTCQAQCSAIASTPRLASDCAAHAIPDSKIASIDAAHPYSLAELVDIAEQNNPTARIAWERAKQRAESLGIARSEYFPILVGIAAFGDSRQISPFPAQLIPKGYSMVEVPFAQPEIALDYLLFDFGRREAKVDSAVAQKLASGAHFIRTNQEVAFRVATAYYNLVTAQERLHAAKETLRTAQTTQDAAEFQLANGRSTMPDVLNARAETAQATFDLESAQGDEMVARVLLTEEIGIEPSPNIVIDAQETAPLPQTITMSIEELIDRAVQSRPDLAEQAAEIRAAGDEVRSARADYRPRITLSASAAQTSLWPTSDSGPLGNASQPTWSATLAVQWRIFDGGARKHALREAESKNREEEDKMTDLHDRATREVWSAYIGFRTAAQKQRAAVALLQSAITSYDASLEAYRYGVRTLVDVVTAQRQLAQARLSNVSARSGLFLGAVDLEFVTGNLLRSQPPATALTPHEDQK